MDGVLYAVKKRVMLETRYTLEGEDLVTEGGHRFRASEGFWMTEENRRIRLVVSVDGAWHLLWDPADWDGRPQEDAQGVHLEEIGPVSRWGACRFLEGVAYGFGKVDAMLLFLERSMTDEMEPEAAGALQDAREKVRCLLKVLLSGEVDE